MTVLVAYNYKGKYLMASDSRMLVNDDEISKVGKMVEFPSFVVGFAGSVGAYTQLMKIRSKKKPLKIKDFNGAIKLQEAFYKKNDIDAELLVITKEGQIYHIDKETIVEHTEKGWHCIGSGAAYAKTIFNLKFPSKKCIIEAIEAAAKFSASCDSEIAIKEI